ncbi:MAG: lactoylglutathione lyase [Pseudomonadota bacterium]|nr:lactoylglutathione lyase [Pseudomonadota bacterium]
MANVKSEFRLLHTMLRVVDLDKSVDFYTRHLGMKLLRRTDFESGRFTLAFVGYGNEEDTAVIELTHNWDQVEQYDKGDGFGHIAIAVSDADTVCKAMEKAGVKVPRPAGPMKGGSRVIAFVEDPDGYKIELVQRK